MRTIRVSVKSNDFEYAEILGKESADSLRIRLSLPNNPLQIEGILTEHSFSVPFGEVYIATDLVAVRPDEFARVMEDA